jgi:hypothetical protein
MLKINRSDCTAGRCLITRLFSSRRALICSRCCSRLISFLSGISESKLKSPRLYKKKKREKITVAHSTIFRDPKTYYVNL